MKIGFVIPARLKSTRLEKKILKLISGQTVLEWCIDRALKAPSIDEVVVATSYIPSDSEVTKICMNKNVRYFLGHPDDVLDRLKETAEYFDFDYVVNITPDNALFSVHLVNLMVSYIKDNPSVDYVSFSNAFLGTGIYALNKKALQTVCEFKKDIDTEIWGPFFHPDFFNNVKLDVPNFLVANVRLTLDTIDDFRLIRSIFEAMGFKPGRHVETEAVLNFLENNPELNKINSQIVQRTVNLNVLDEISNHFSENIIKFEEIRKKYY
ncbi:cytidylyltransferase domain-containing protein [Candidatus Xianfuyuplasma coldseepsis]|uniref:3-deoxy-manno-octulosonate cytidylyltransferase n=1 Tax=Candidatus Xianfuyuplasma coldseepsis TaxID=2782163 RepID=A0A7L7KP17_9MOLU|nr:hypothetical protein [Xianfuyuplasma coldseepsis]QMS84521.1 hypothetical protein G4Z02_01750 [Xianfuyuplasma coldseepsis]